MLLAERQTLILEQLNRKGRVYAADLAAQLQVSEDTIRRDLNKLGELKMLRRVHGGALPLQYDVPDYADRLENLDTNKQKLAEAALAYIQPGQTVLINSGSTCRYMAKALPKDIALTVVTACPLIACELTKHDKIEVIMIGGIFFKPALRCVGTTATEMIRRMRFDVCFMGLCALHPERGFSAKYMEEADIMRISIEQADKTVVIGRADRLGVVAGHQVVAANELDVLITDNQANDDMVDALREQSITVVKV